MKKAIAYIGKLNTMNSLSNNRDGGEFFYRVSQSARVHSAPRYLPYSGQTEVWYLSGSATIRERLKVAALTT